MTRKVVVSFILGVVAVSVLVSAHSQSWSNLFRDKQSRFTVSVPQGWTTAMLDENTVQVASPPAYVTIFVFHTSADAQAIVAQLMAQIGPQWQGLKQVRADQTTVSGRPAYSVVYSGTNPKGVPSALRIIGLTLDKDGYALMFSVPVDRFDALKPALDSIERSFSVAKAGAGVSAGPVRPVPPRPGSKPSIQQPAQIPRGGVPVFPVRAGFCYGMAPAGWKVTGVLPDGKGFALGNSDFSAAYTIEAYTPVFIQMEQPYCADPRACVQAKVAKISRDVGQGPILQMSQIQQYGEMFVQEFDNATRHTVAMYSFYPMSMGGYVLVYRSAVGLKDRWQSYGTNAILVAGSIRCQAQYRPSPSVNVGGRERGSSGESTYNVQLGTEYAHDPETGETFFMKHADDWMEAGPDGPGYYRQIPGGSRKLVPGLPQ